MIGFTTAVSGPLAAILALAASVNLALALFNLIPGLPLDGGNIFKAVVWKITVSPYKGVVFASRIGQAFGWLAIISGIIPLLLFGSFGNFWNLLIGFFVLQNAGNPAEYAKLQEKLTGLTATDVVTDNSPIVSESLSLREFADQRILPGQSWYRFLVTDDNGQLLGTISVDDLRTIPTAEWCKTKVTAVMQPVEYTQTINSNQSLWEVIQLLKGKRLSGLPVISNNGVLVGILEKAAIINQLQKPLQNNPA